MWFDTNSYIADNYDFMSHKHHISLLKRGVFLDTAPLYILVVGHYDKINGTKFISKFQSKSKKKDRRYAVYDYNYLLAFLNSCGLGKKYDLFITPHIFTEFVKHLWEYIENPEHFNKILKNFKNKKYIKEKFLDCFKIIEEKDFLRRRIEIGDISLTVICKDEENPFKTILTDDEDFARIANEEYGFLVVYYDCIRIGTIQLDYKNIPEKLLKEPNL